jgi:putative peptidoglycan lipid II flippase
LTRAVESPLVRGGLTIVAGVLTGNVLGFVRVAVTAYLLGTHSRADTLAVAMGPMDTLNSVVINSIVFAFVPMLAAAAERERPALFRQLLRLFSRVFAAIAAVLIVAAPWLMRALAPGLDPHYFGAAVILLRIFALSTLASGTSAVYCALLYTDRRFAPAAFYQAALNVCTITGALALWKLAGVYAFAIGYTVGACAQLAILHFATRRDLAGARHSGIPVRWREVLAKPAFFVVYAAGLGLNITFTRAWATHAGPGMAAALDYCMRGVSVPLALLVNPISNSLLPEIARLRSLLRWREAFRLIDKTIALAALVAVGGCGFAILFRQPAIALLFERGSFTAESTLMVSAVFLGLGPSLVGWSLTEIVARSLFALDRPWPPVIAAAIPVVFNVIFTLGRHSHQPQWIGLGATLGLLLGFLTLFAMMHGGRKRWLGEEQIGAPIQRGGSLLD